MPALKANTHPCAPHTAAPPHVHAPRATTSCLLPRALAGSLLVPCSCLAKTPPAQMVSPAAAPGDGAPDSKDHSAVIKMNQHTRLSQARSEEPAPIKLNDQHNTHPMTVRAHNGRRAVP